MNLYLISQSENDGWDTYDSAVVVAETPSVARELHPAGELWNWVSEAHQRSTQKNLKWSYWGSTWASDPKNVTVEYLGVADESLKPGVVCASFKAG